MYLVQSFVPNKKSIVASFLVLLSLLLSVYGPMASISSAQSAIDTSKFQALKQKVLDELNRRITGYKQSLENLNVDAKYDVDKNGIKASFSSGNIKADGSVTTTSPSPSATPASGASVTLDPSNMLSTILTLPDGLQDKVKSFMQKVLDELTSLQSQVTNLTPTSTASGSGSSAIDPLTQLQNVGKNLDSQFNLDQLTQVQSTVTQAVDSMTGVLDSLKSSFAGIQSQVDNVKQCLKNGAQNGQVSASGNASSSGASGDVSTNGVSCDLFNTSSSDVGANAQSQLDNVTQVMSTISSVLFSAVSLLTTLVSQFGSLTGGLGSLGSLGNIGSLSDMSNLGNLSSLTGSLGNVSGLLSSFSAISSQLDIANGMSGNASNLLGSLGNYVNVGGLGL